MKYTLTQSIRLSYFILAVSILLSACGNKTHIDSLEKVGLKDFTQIPIGAGVNINQVLKDKKLENIVIDDFSSLTSTNHMKMYTIARQEGERNWTSADKLIEFSKKHDKRVFGHALVWHYGLPQWISDNAKSEGNDWTKTFLKEYIHKVVGRYKGEVAAWDVVNEAFESAGSNWRETFWYETYGGPEYIADAFRWAHEADPEAELFYNDFNIERDTAKLHAMLRMVDNLIEEDVPITGIGFQMHLRMDIPDETIAYCLQKAADTGLQIHISELDIIFNTHDDNQGGGQQIITELTDELRTEQAEKYNNLVLMYRSIVPEDQQYGITFWDFTDRDTWINSFFKINDWPTIFDENLEQKPAYQGFKDGLTQTLK